jgi:hypothetical protein
VRVEAAISGLLAVGFMTLLWNESGLNCSFAGRERDSSLTKYREMIKMRIGIIGT